MKFGDLIVSKTAYPAAAMVNLKECNVSQDTIAIRLNLLGKTHFKSGFIAAFLNTKQGHALMVRRFQGNVQQHLSLEDGKAIRIPKFAGTLQRRVHDMVHAADRKQDESAAKQKEAEDTLLGALGMADWTPPEPFSYTARASYAVAAGRMDAPFFAPRIQALLDTLSRDGRVIGDLTTPPAPKIPPRLLREIPLYRNREYRRYGRSEKHPACLCRRT